MTISGESDFHSGAPVAALAQAQQLFGTHLELVGSSRGQPPQVGPGALERTQLQETTEQVSARLRHLQV